MEYELKRDDTFKNDSTLFTDDQVESLLTSEPIKISVLKEFAEIVLFEEEQQRRNREFAEHCDIDIDENWNEYSYDAFSAAEKRCTECIAKYVDDAYIFSYATTVCFKDGEFTNELLCEHPSKLTMIMKYHGQRYTFDVRFNNKRTKAYFRAYKCSEGWPYQSSDIRLKELKKVPGVLLFHVLQAFVDNSSGHADGANMYVTMMESTNPHRFINYYYYDYKSTNVKLYACEREPGFYDGKVMNAPEFSEAFGELDN